MWRKARIWCQLLCECQVAAAASEPQHFLYDEASIASRQLTAAPAAVATTTSRTATEADHSASATVDTAQPTYVVVTHSHTHTRPFNGPFSGTTWVSRYQKGKPNLDFTEARDSEWQWHQLGHMQVCTSLQTDKHAGTPPLSFLQTGCPSCRPTNSVKALTAGC